MKTILEQYKKEVGQELKEILLYWAQYALDAKNGGFYGEISNDNIPDASADKGSVLNARILWTFAKAYNHTKYAHYLSLAKRAYQFIIDYFFDKEFGGVYWTVAANGDPASAKKQIYAQAFCIYGLSEYYKAPQDDEALRYAVSLFDLIEQYSFDREQGGSYEAFARDRKSVE